MTRLYGYFYDFLVDYDSIDVSDILDVQCVSPKNQQCKA